MAFAILVNGLALPQVNRAQGDVLALSIQDDPTAGAGPYTWVMTDQPETSVNPITTPTAATAGFTIDSASPGGTGSYHLQLTAGAQSVAGGFSVPLPNTGQRVPTFKEKLLFGIKGWKVALNKVIRYVDAFAGAQDVYTSFASIPHAHGGVLTVSHEVGQCNRAYSELELTARTDQQVTVGTLTIRVYGGVAGATLKGSMTIGVGEVKKEAIITPGTGWTKNDIIRIEQEITADYENTGAVPAVLRVSGLMRQVIT